DFTVIVNLTQLGIHNTNLNSEMVKKFPNSNVLFSLALRDNKKLKDITPIKKYSLVTSLQIANNSIENIDFVKEMPQLSSFYLSDNKIKSLDALKNHPTIIKTLSADRNLLTDINFIKDVKLDKGKATSTFRFHENQIIDFSPIKGQLDSGRVFAADKQRIFLNDIQLGEETDLSSLKDVTGEAFPYYVKFNNMGTFQQKGANIVWDSITPEDNPNYNSVLIRDYNTNERDVSISIVLTQKVNKVSFNNYNVKYNKDEDVKGEVPKDNVIYDFDDTITLADKGSMDKKGSKFIGWNTQEDGKGKLYKAKETVKINELIKEKEKGNETKAINFYAQWEKSEDKKEPNITKAGSNAFMIVTLLLGMSTSAYAIKKYNIL
ncbi:MAG: InlB B-repeat-containing protein, partial [Erysipelotrichales bacterium]